MIFPLATGRSEMSGYALAHLGSVRIPIPLPPFGMGFAKLSKLD